MDCTKFLGCKREFRLSRDQRDNALNRAFQLDINSPKADIRARYPYRWEIRKVTTIVHHFSEVEQHWYLFTEDEALPGIGVHIVVFMVQRDKMIHSIDLRKHEQAETLFKTELLRIRGNYTVPLDDLEQDRMLLRQEMDEASLPESWKPAPPPPPNS